MLKILMISTVPITKNGITGVIINIISAINDQNIVIDLACPNKPEKQYYELLSSKGGKIYSINRTVKQPIRYIYALTKIIRSNEYDIIHAHGNSSSLVMEMISGILSGVKVRIAHSHNTTCSEIRLHKALNPIFQKTFTYGMACGEDAGKWLFGDKEFYVTKNGIDTNQYRYNALKREKIRGQLNLSVNDFVIGHVGTLNNQKNQQYLLSVISTIPKDYRLKLLLIGDGKNRGEIEELVCNLEIKDRVIMIGSVDDVSPYLSAMDMIAMPSLYEGLPLTLIEEQANGLVCLVSDAITREADLSGYVEFISLNNENEWKEKILLQYEASNANQRDARSFSATQKIIESGYSIADEAEKVRRMYYKLRNQESKS